MRNGPLRVAPVLTLLLACALALGSGGAAATEAAGERLIADGPVPDLILLYSGDVIGYVGPCG